MSRVKRGVMHAKRRRYLLRRVKGFRWGRKSKITLAKTAATKAGVYAYRDRRNKKREFRKLWTIRLNAAARENGMSYSTLIAKLHKAKVDIDRKILSQLAIEHPKAFQFIVEKVR